MQIPEKYIYQSGHQKGNIKQKLIQTGEPKGSYSKGDKHPHISGLFYWQWTGVREYWVDLHTFERLEKKRIISSGKYDKSDKRKLVNARSRARYFKTEKGKACRKKYLDSDKGRARTRECLRRFRKTDKGKVNTKMSNANRRARRTATKLTYTENQLIKQYYNHSVRLKNKLGIEFHVDHIVPLSLGGLHHPSNLQVVPAVWNMRKHNNNTDQWLPYGL